MMRYFYAAKVARVVDGDTIDFMIDLGFGIYHKVRVRLYGVNTPETRTRDELEKAAGLAAKEYVYDWLSGREEVYVKTIKDEGGKYGRILGFVYSDPELQVCLNDDLVDSGHAEPYYGGKR